MKRKKSLYNYCLLYFIAALLMGTPLSAQEDSAEVEKQPILNLQYYNEQNAIQYLLFKGIVKTGKKIEPLSNISFTIFINDETDESNVVAKLVTDKDGVAKTFLPVSLNEKWLQSNPVKFIVITDSIPELGIQQQDIEITKARIKIDTLIEDDIKKVVAFVEEKQDSLWVPVSDVEIKLGVKRLGSILKLGEEESYSTDSSGTVITEFILDSIPGNENGLIHIIAKIEDNEMYGNLQHEKPVYWGKQRANINIINLRTLWSTGDKVPIWLLSLALFIIISVWGVLIYLIIQFWKIRKLGLIKN